MWSPGSYRRWRGYRCSSAPSWCSSTVTAGRRRRSPTRWGSRHRPCTCTSTGRSSDCERSWRSEMPADISQQLRDLAQALDELTGEVEPAEVLDRVAERRWSATPEVTASPPRHTSRGAWWVAAASIVLAFGL